MASAAPHDRYTVGSVTGFPVSDRKSEMSRSTPAVSLWYVHDSAYCYRIVREFRGKNAEARARRLAAELNAGTQTTEAPRKLRPVRRHSVPPPPFDAWLAGLATHCKKGHKYTEATTLWTRSRGRLARRCRICREATRRAA